ncbi:MAG: SAM-dependent methyltransferase [Chlamydiales bacterium]|jgi:SAM-dependent methyltransferase
MVDSPWYVDAFSADYPAVYPHRDQASARREVDWILSLGFGGRLLDLCCGFGRHSVALAGAGCDVVGLDLSFDLLLQACGLEAGELVAGRLLRADARFLPLAAGACDGVLNLFSSFGYFGEDGDELVAREISRVLKPGGRALFDLMNPARIRSGLVPHSETERDGLRIVESRSLEQDGRRVVKQVDIEMPDGSRRSWREDVRLYDPPEIEALLGRAGLRVEVTWGEFGNTPFGPESARQVVVARRQS